MNGFLRHSSRHIQHTVLNRVGNQLSALGWTDPTTLPFGSAYSAPVTMSDAPSVGLDGLADGVEAGLVSCTLGLEVDARLEELGGPLAHQKYPLFFDLFQGSYATTTALANDIRDTLLGRFPGTSRVFPIVDQTDGSATDWLCELIDVEISRPEIRLPVHWQVVKVTADVYFQEVQYS